MHLLFLILDVGVDQQRVGLNVYVLHSYLKAVEAPGLWQCDLGREVPAKVLIRTLVRQIEDQGYSVQTYLFLNNNLRALPPSDRHWAVVIGGAILVIVPPSSSDSSVDPSDGTSSISASCSSRISSIDDSDQVDLDFPWLGKG